jgi:hypothetical protein
MSCLRALILSLLAFVGCSKPAGPSHAESKIIVDQQHNQATTKEAPAYDIAPSTRLVIDARGFQFTYGTEKIVPEVAQVVIDSSHVYQVTIGREGEFTLDRSTAVPLRGGPFEGFRSGTKVIVAIGRSSAASDQSKVSFKVSWVAEVRVQ